MEGADTLLPGMPNDITRQLIVPKLSFSAFQMLSWVSHGWRRVIQNREIYDIRVRTNSTKSLGTFVYTEDKEEEEEGSMETEDEGEFGHGRCVISLYCMEENWTFRLPPIPTVGGKNRRRFGCVTLDGKVYLLGGAVISDHCGADVYEALSEVYVMDVAGMNWQWKQCASMRQDRAQFGCGVAGGKIYVFGGWSIHIRKDTGFHQEGEVYDPEQDTWSPIKATSVVGQIHSNVTVIGEELLVYNCGHPNQEYFNPNESISDNFLRFLILL